MFGEEYIYGITESSVDDKGRFWLPEFTYAEPGDSLLIIKEEDLLRITSEEHINNLIDEIEERIKSETDEEKIKIMKDKLYKLYESIIKKCKVDKSRRITLGQKSDYKKKYKIIGARKEIILRKVNED